MRCGLWRLMSILAGEMSWEDLSLSKSYSCVREVDM